MGPAKAERATVGRLKFAADGMAVEPAASYGRQRFNGNCMARDFVGSAVSCRRRSFFLSDRYDGTDHQAFDPNRDDRFSRPYTIRVLLGRLGHSRVFGY